MPSDVPQCLNVLATTNPPADLTNGTDSASHVQDADILVGNGLVVKGVVMMTLMVSKRARPVVEATISSSGSIVRCIKGVCVVLCQ